MAKTTSKIAEVLIDDDEIVEDPAPKPEPTIVAPATKNAKIKGTWTMYYGTTRWDFVDGQRYELPLDLFNYLKKNSCIYDTL